MRPRQNTYCWIGTRLLAVVAAFGGTTLAFAESIEPDDLPDPLTGHTNQDRHWDHTNQDTIPPQSTDPLGPSLATDPLFLADPRSSEGAKQLTPPKHIPVLPPAERIELDDYVLLNGGWDDLLDPVLSTREPIDRDSSLHQLVNPGDVLPLQPQASPFDSAVFDTFAAHIMRDTAFFSLSGSPPPIPAPGVLAVLGLGALSLRRRRRIH